MTKMYKYSSMQFVTCIVLAIVFVLSGFDQVAEAVSTQSPSAATTPSWKPTVIGTDTCVSRDDNNYTFFYSVFQASFNISYKLARHSGAGVEDTAYTPNAVNMPSTANCDGSQSDDCSQINVTYTWTADPEFPDQEWSLLVVFEAKDVPDKNNLCDTSKQNDWDDFEYELTGLELNYFIEENYFPNAKLEGQELSSGNFTLAWFNTDSDSSYKCESEETYTVTDSVQVTLKDYQSQAFQFESKKDKEEFDTAKTCKDDDDGSSLVPIIVGCVLAGLIIITLVAYFIGRWHQNKQEAYQAL